jgi:hypothetical protein
MPVTPAPWTAFESVSANKLNTDLYTFIPGNAFTPNGILFHAQRPILSDFVALWTGGSCPANTNTAFSAYTAFNNVNLVDWYNYWDSAAYYGPGADSAGNEAAGTFTPVTLGGQGNVETTQHGGGFYVALGQLVMGACPTAFGGLGIGISNSSVGSGNPAPMLANQLYSNQRDGCAYGLAVIAPAGGGVGVPNQEVYNLGVNCAITTGTSTVNPHAGGGDWSGENSKFQVWWASISNNEVTVAGGPTPPAAFTGSTSVTSTLMNNGVTNTLNFLNQPPLFQATSINSNTIASGTATQVSLTAPGASPFLPQVDTFNGLSGSTYTVPVSGVYLVHGSVAYSSSGSAFNCVAGVQINSTNYWGPAYQQVGAGTGVGATMPAYTALLDLNAGDTVKLMTYNNLSGGAGLNNGAKAPCKLLLQWMGALGVPSTLWNNPDTSYRWAAGTPANQMAATFNQYLTNDLGFLVNRPYLLSTQTTQQTGLVTGAEVTVTTAVGGRVHASNGDNYSGWTSGSSNLYTCQRAGWYLAVGSYIISNLGSGHNTNIIGQAKIPGIAGSGQNSVQYWGQHVPSESASLSPGADFVNVVYLGVGDTIQPQIMVQSTLANFQTSVNQVITGQASTFGLVWLGQ